ncbi:MAG: ArsA-related P-loop ATPase [Micropruina sp.]
MDSSCPLHVVTGKGGVGKTTLSLALAASLAAAGARVLVCEVEGRDGFREATGRGVGRRPTRMFRAGRGLVSGIQIDARDALPAYLDRRFPLLGPLVAAAPPLIDFATSIAPGLRDILLIGSITHQFLGPDWDAIVLDAPPTGRVASFLGAGAGLNALASDGPIADQANEVMLALRRPATRVHVASTPAELPVTEALDAIDQLNELGLHVADVIVNRVRRSDSLPAELSAPDGLSDAAWAALLADQEVEGQHVADEQHWLHHVSGLAGRPLVEVGEHVGELGLVGILGLAPQLAGVAR